MSRNAVTIAGLLLFALCLACAAQSPVQFGLGSGDLSPVKFGGKKLPSWLTSDYAPIWNGVNNWASAPTKLVTDAQNQTMMAWVKPYNTVINSQFITLGNLPGFVWYVSTNNVHVIRFGTGVEYVQSTNNSVVPGYWQHVAWVKTSGIAKLYLNGTLNATNIATTSAWVDSFSGNAIIGARTSSLQFANMSLAELSFWNRALSADEINRYKDKRLKGTESGLVALYHMNDNAQTLIDSCSNGTPKNAVASNSITWTRRNPYPSGDIRAERYVTSYDSVDDFASGVCTISTYPFTIETWGMTNGYSAGNNGIFCGIGSTATTTAAFSAYVQTLVSGGVHYFNFVRWPAGGAVSTIVASTTVNGFWVHLALVAEAHNLVKCYANGVQIGTSTTSIPDLGSPNAIRLGRVGAFYGKCKLAETRFWSTARTPAEIQANLYTQMTGSETGLVYYYRGNEGTGTTLTNLGSAGAAGNLTLYNSPTWVGRDIP